jgi:peptidyl-prolyl cis-trans isomerase SurA
MNNINQEKTVKKILLLVSLALFMCTCNSYAIEDKVVAIVNNEVITKAELDVYINLLKMQIGESGWQQYGMTQRKVLEDLIEKRLIVQEAKNKKIQADERIVESRLAKMEKGFSSSGEFSDFLRQQGLSLSELEGHVKEQILGEKLINSQIRSMIFINPSEVTDYYRNHTSDFCFPERVQVDSIFTEGEDAIKEAYGKLESGADFPQIQKQYSQRSNLGLIDKGQLRPEIEGVIFSLEVGKFSEPFPTREGYYIFLVREKLPPSQKKLTDVQPEIYNMLWEEKFNTKLKQFIQELKEKAYIVIKDE